VRHKNVFAEEIAWNTDQQGVRFAQFALAEDCSTDPPAVVLAEFAPGEQVPAHTHACNYLEYIVAGSQVVGKVEFKAGDVRWAAACTGYGPIRVGPDGCKVLIVFQSVSKTAPISRGKTPG